MASSRDSVALAIWRKLGEPENAQKIIDMGGVALVALIRWTVIFLVLYPLANAGAKWIDTDRTATESLVKAIEDGTVTIKATEPAGP